jgi:deazaflavin-dependent oxidoreductase (nitroreductase family)
MIWKRMWRAAGSLPGFAAVASRLTVPDRWISRVTKGRVVALGMADSLLLTTVGRRSGQRRSSPLLYIRDGDAYVVIGSNWGKTTDPAWAHNLLAEPSAEVTVGGQTLGVVAAPAEGAERERLWQALLVVWPAYRGYEARAGGRPLRIFRLVPAREFPGCDHPGPGTKLGA